METLRDLLLRLLQGDLIGTPGAAIVISLVALGASFAVPIFLDRRRERISRETRTDDLVRDSRSRLLLQLERLRFWDAANGDNPAYDAIAQARAIIAEEPTCVTDRGRARSAVEDIEINVAHCMRLETGASKLNSLNPEFHAKRFAQSMSYKFAIDNACTTIVELASPADSGTSEPR